MSLTAKKPSTYAGSSTDSTAVNTNGRAIAAATAAACSLPKLPQQSNAALNSHAD
jgi:hypothetical protein